MPEYLHPGVYVQEESSGAKPIEAAGTSTCCFVGEAKRGRPNYPTFVTSWTDFQRRFGGIDKKKMMPLAVRQFFENGGSRAYVVRVLPSNAVAAKLAVGPVKIEAIGAGEWGKHLAVTIQKHQITDKVPQPDGTSKECTEIRWHWAVYLRNSEDEPYFEVESWSSLGGSESADRFYAAIINRDSTYIRIRPDDGNYAVPTGGTPDPTPPSTTLPPQALQDGTDGSDEGPTTENYGTALSSLDRINDASLLCVPGAKAEIVNKALGYVETRKLKDLFYIVDPPQTNDSDPIQAIADIKTFLNQTLTTKSSYGGLYFPWVLVADPYSNVSGATQLVPPSGMLAGLYARTDNSRGVWKAPAGVEASLLGVVGLPVNVTDADQDALNPIGINCIRQFPAAGIVVWGARTLSTQSNPEYRYIPVRRTAIFLEVSLFRGTQWVVFEPNDEPLWSSIRFNLNAFMLTQYRAGAFQGAKPSDAYVVKCDAENNVQATIDAGQVHILVAFAPLKPAEFVILHIQQKRKE